MLRFLWDSGVPKFQRKVNEKLLGQFCINGHLKPENELSGWGISQ